MASLPSSQPQHPTGLGTWNYREVYILHGLTVSSIWDYGDNNLKSCDRTGCRTLKKCVLSFSFHVKSRGITCLNKVHFWKFCQMFTWFHTANVHPFSQWFWGQPSQRYPHGPMAQSLKRQSQQLNFPAVRSSCRTNAAPGGQPVTPRRWIFSHWRAGRIFFPPNATFFRRFWHPGWWPSRKVVAEVAAVMLNTGNLNI